MRLIDADALPITPVDITDLPKDGTALIVYSKENVDNAPTVDIVQCKDCKYWHEHYIADSTCCWYWSEWSMACIMPTDADDFCSRGERRGEEEC